MCMLIMTQGEIQLYFNIFTNLPLLLCSSTTLSRHLYRTNQLRQQIMHDSIFEQNENKILDLFMLDISRCYFKSHTLYLDLIDRLVGIIQYVMQLIPSK